MFKIWKRKEKQASLSDRNAIVPIVSDAAVATGAVGDGRLVPLVILDTTNRPDLIDLFKAHDKMPPGDADTTWVSIGGFEDHLGLWFRFKKPFEVDAVLNFELSEHGLTVDMTMNARAVYLQVGKPGDRFYKAMEAPRIIVEIGACMATQEWEKIWLRAIRNRLRKEGTKRHEAKRLAPEYMAHVRSKMSQFKNMPSGVYVIPDEQECL